MRASADPCSMISTDRMSPRCTAITPVNSCRTPKPARAWIIRPIFSLVVAGVMRVLWGRPSACGGLSGRPSLSSRQRISNLIAIRTIKMGERSERVRPQAGRGHDVLHRNAAHAKRIGDERAVAAPGHRLRTHDGRAAGAGKLAELVEGRGEFRCPHVIGQSAK